MSPYTTNEARRARSWWRALAAPSSSDSAGAGGARAADTGALARLRRVRSPLEAMMHVEAIDLVLEIAPDGHPHAQERVAGLAALLAHVRGDDPERSVAGRLGGRDPDQRLMKPARFRKLMLAAPGEERLTAFRRAIRLLGPSANVADLATAWLLWDHPSRGDRTRAEWMFRYVGASGGDAPAGTTEEPSTPPADAIEETTR